MHVDSVGETDEHDATKPSRANNAQRKQQRLQFDSVKARSKRTHTNARAQTNEDNTATNRLAKSQLETSISNNTRTNGQISRMKAASSASSKEQQVNSRQKAIKEPPLHSVLSAEAIFKSLSRTVKVLPQQYSSQSSPPFPVNRGVHDACTSLTHNYPNDIELCSGSLSDLFIIVRKEISDEETVIIFRSVLAVFHKRCSTFLDLLVSDHNSACIQLKCWTLVFEMVNLNLHKKLQANDGAVFCVFTNPAVIASHVLLQIIDCLYSQILWREWGGVPQFNANVFECFDQLRNQIGLVVPLVKLVPDLLRTKFSSQCWHRSQLTDEKENDRSMLYFVSSINPNEHIQFLTTGQYQNLAVEGKIELRCMMRFQNPQVESNSNGSSSRVIFRGISSGHVRA
jgi:hypothetical protein